MKKFLSLLVFFLILATVSAEDTIAEDANASTEAFFGIPEIDGFFEMFGPITGGLKNLTGNVTATEWGLILLLIPAAFLMLRANFYTQLLLKIGAVVIIVAVIAIFAGVVNF